MWGGRTEQKGTGHLFFESLEWGVLCNFDPRLGSGSRFLQPSLFNAITYASLAKLNVFSLYLKTTGQGLDRSVYWSWVY